MRKILAIQRGLRFLKTMKPARGKFQYQRGLEFLKIEHSKGFEISCGYQRGQRNTFECPREVSIAEMDILHTRETNNFWKSLNTPSSYNVIFCDCH